jgi:hypothetical protein
MSIQCEDRERIFLDGAPEEWTALEQHAASCPSCAEELRAWRELSTAVAELRNHQEDPALWSRIASSLAAPLEDQSARNAAREKRWAFLRFGWRSPAGWRLPLVWQTAFAAVLVLAFAFGGVYLYVQHQRFGTSASGTSGFGTTANNAKNPFLNDRALAEVQRTENAYMQAIDKLAEEAKPQLDSGNSPLMDSYREKLLVLDSAIDELRAQAGENPSNAHLRYQLLAMYREKQGTLEDILESKR